MMNDDHVTVSVERDVVGMVDERPGTTTTTTTTSSSSSSNNHHHYYSTIPELILLLKQLRMNDPSVKHVCIQCKTLPIAYLESFFTLLIPNTFVTHVTLIQCHITDDIMIHHITKLIQYNRTIIDLDLSRNHLTDLSAEHFVEAFTISSSSSSSSVSLRPTTRPTLRKLTLQGNHFTPRGIHTICSVISQTQIQVLKIGKMRLDDMGARGVAQMLMDPSCPLRKLDLRSSQLGTSSSNKGGGISIISQAIAVNRSLEVLCLGKNHITDEDIVDLVTALQTNASLRTLDVQYNPITNVGAKLFLQCLDDNDDDEIGNESNNHHQHGNYTLRKLKLRHCDEISDDIKATIMDVLVMNSYGPELALKTKCALRSILVEESSSSSSDSSSSDSDFIYSNSTDEVDIRPNNDDLGQTTVITTNHSCHNIPTTHTLSSATATTTTTATTSKKYDETCVICYEHRAECILLPCRHRNCCTHCAYKLKSCHMCREVIVKIFFPQQNIYTSNPSNNPTRVAV